MLWSWGGPIEWRSIKQKSQALSTTEAEYMAARDAAKSAMGAGSALSDVVNVPARSALLRGRFEEGYIDRIDDMVKAMVDEIEATVEEN